MTQSYWPFDGVDTTETQYSQLFRRMQYTGVWANPGDSTLKVVPQALMQVQLSLQSALQAYALVRGHMYSTDAAVTGLTIGVAPSAGQTRRDTIVLRLDPTANTITPVVVAGTAAATGTQTAPALQATDAAQYDLPLADIDVVSGTTTISAGMITDRRLYMGHVFGLWTTANRPTTPRDGQPGFNSTLRVPEYWDANTTTWIPMVLTAVTAAMIAGSEQLLLSVGNSKKVNGLNVTSNQTAPTTPNDKDLWFSF